MSENTYFVNKPTQERAGVIMDKIDKWGTSLDTSGYMEKLRLCGELTTESISKTVQMVTKLLLLASKVN